jgi:TonB family protein
MSCRSVSLRLAALALGLAGSPFACAGQPPSSPASVSEVDGGAPTTTFTAPATAEAMASAAPPANSAPPAAPPAPAPASSASAGPDRTMDDIRAVVSAHRDVFRACYDESQKAHPGVKGALVLHFMVNPDGSVKSAEIDPKRSDIHAPDLDACAVKAVKKLKFPPSRKGMESTVNYPFDFHPRTSLKTGAGSP